LRINLVFLLINKNYKNIAVTLFYFKIDNEPDYDFQHGNITVYDFWNGDSTIHLVIELYILKRWVNFNRLKGMVIWFIGAPQANLFH